MASSFSVAVAIALWIFSAQSRCRPKKVFAGGGKGTRVYFPAPRLELFVVFAAKIMASANRRRPGRSSSHEATPERPCTTISTRDASRPFARTAGLARAALMVWWALSSCVATVSAVYTYTFCDSTVPDGLRVSSGSYTFGDASTDYNCLAATVSQSTTVSRLDTGGASWEDVRLSETWWQQTFTRDHLLCVRTQTAATTTWTGVDAWTSAENGYCCKIATSSSSLSYLRIEKHTGSTVSYLATGSTFSTSDGYGEDVLYTFEAKVIGDTITCTHYDQDGTELSSVSTTDSTYSSGGAAFMVWGGSLTHYLGMSVIDLAPTALPTPAPTLEPTLDPTTGEDYVACLHLPVCLLAC